MKPGVKRSGSPKKKSAKVPKLDSPNLDTLILDILAHLFRFLDSVDILRLGQNVCKSLRRNARNAVQLCPKDLNITQYCSSLMKRTKNLESGSNPGQTCRPEPWLNLDIPRILEPWTNGLRSLRFGNEFGTRWDTKEQLTQVLKIVRKWSKKPVELYLTFQFVHIKYINGFTGLKRLELSHPLHLLDKKKFSPDAYNRRGERAMVELLTCLTCLEWLQLEFMTLPIFAALPLSLKYLNFQYQSMDILQRITLITEEKKVHSNLDTLVFSGRVEHLLYICEQSNSTFPSLRQLTYYPGVCPATTMQGLEMLSPFLGTLPSLELIRVRMGGWEGHGAFNFATRLKTVSNYIKKDIILAVSQFPIRILMCPPPDPSSLPFNDQFGGLSKQRGVVKEALQEHFGRRVNFEPTPGNDIYESDEKNAKRGRRIGIFCKLHSI